jgi:hypothetical protein
MLIDVKFIGCGVKMWAVGRVIPDWAFYQAKDAAGQSVSCATTDVSMFEAIYAVNAYSFIQFNWDPTVDPVADLGVVELVVNGGALRQLTSIEGPKGSAQYRD